LLEIVRRYSKGNPYLTVTYDQIAPADWAKMSEKTIEAIIRAYLTGTAIDYIRLRWFYRRLAQIGHPGAITISLDNLGTLGPCFSSIFHYLASIQSIDG